MQMNNAPYRVVLTWRGHYDEEGFERFDVMEEAKQFVQDEFDLTNEEWDVLRSTGEFIEGDRLSADGGISLTLAKEVPDAE